MTAIPAIDRDQFRTYLQTQPEDRVFATGDGRSCPLHCYLDEVQGLNLYVNNTWIRPNDHRATDPYAGLLEQRDTEVWEKCFIDTIDKIGNSSEPTYRQVTPAECLAVLDGCQGKDV